VSIKLERWDNEYEIAFEVTTYRYGGSLAIQMSYKEESYWLPYTTLTVNLEDFPTENDKAFVDTNNLGDEIVDWIVQNDLGELTGRIGFSGYCVYPEVQFNLDKIKEHEVN
jgi:hypothetical protein